MFFIEFRQRVQARGDSRYGRRVGREGAQGGAAPARDERWAGEVPADQDHVGRLPRFSNRGWGLCSRAPETGGLERILDRGSAGLSILASTLKICLGAIFSIPAGDALPRAACRDVCQNMHTPVHDESMKPMEIASETAACNAHRRRFYVCIVCPGLASCGEFDQVDKMQ
uniref:Uncharacterized protein n=1 Tax=Oryza barthii TaxID=65489 RepID=A0A0D3FPK3_9ORYZ